MNGFGAWLPGWRHFFSWKGRIGRRTFFGGYVALCFISGAVGMLVLGPLMLSSSTSFETINAIGFILIGAGFIPLSALFAQRVHDLGWSAFIPLVLFAILAAPMFALMDFGSGVFGYALARAAHSVGLDMAGLFPIVMIGNGLWMLFAIFVIARKGKAEANRFGPPPALA
ncbi:DUF805 domain-containing protein [Candidatus Viadribacter manganicus]|uniref:DUF805 domain-containing protein n=1 Tax=Candidatus Viadribacter manganicus TaxID=1759059 RepID=UPI001D173AB3|nr:DUF805 domain-containing protein [Candidatus Viadribacter manganicus]